MLGELEKKIDDELSEGEVEAVADKAAEAELEDRTGTRLEQVFKGDGLKEEPAEDSEESDDSTPETEEKPDEEDDSTPEEDDKTEPDAEEKDTDVEEDEAKDEDADKGDEEKEDVPQLSDAYYRAAIHRGMKPEEIEKFYESNPELCVKTLGNVYEAVKRSNEEFATLGRAHKAQEAAKAAAEATPPKTEKSEYKGVDFDALDKAEIDPDAVAIIKTMDKQNKVLFEQVQEMRETRPAPGTEQPSGQESRTLAQETAAIQQQIEGFFKGDEVKLYGDFYGVTPKDAINWDSLSPGQKANRLAVIDMCDDMLIGSQMNNRDMSIDEAMKLAHLNISESQREKVIREKLKANVTKRSKSLTLKPSSSAAKSGSSKPSSDKELIETTQERLDKIKW